MVLISLLETISSFQANRISTTTEKNLTNKVELYIREPYKLILGKVYYRIVSTGIINYTTESHCRDIVVRYCGIHGYGIVNKFLEKRMPIVLLPCVNKKPLTFKSETDSISFEISFFEFLLL